MNGDDIKEDASVAKFFEKAKAYENLCSNRPDVPKVDDPDEEIGKRLTRLKARDKNDDFENLIWKTQT